MATIKYLSEFYTFKAVNPGTRIVNDPSSSLEKQIYAYMLLGNWSYFQGKYAAALSEYQAAWGLLPAVLSPSFPSYLGRVNDDLLLSLDLVDPLTLASAEIQRFRDIAGPKAPLGSTANPPPAMQEIEKAFGTAVSTPAERHLDRAVAFLQLGQTDLAQEELASALRHARPDSDLAADIRSAQAAGEAAAGKYGEAQEVFEAAAKQYAHAGKQAQAAAMMHNAGVAQTLRGDAAGAARKFVDAASFSPLSAGWKLTHTVNPGIASFDRAPGSEGLPLLISQSSGTWAEIPTGKPQAPKNTLSVVKNGGAVHIDLAGGNPATAIRAQLLEARVAATTLSELDTHIWLEPQFVTYLAHVSGFLLPLSLGDTYSALGDYSKASTYYLKARDYPFLNLAIERPMLWTRLARTFVRLGNRLYRDRDMAGARVQYEQVVRITTTGFDLTGPLYSGAFAALRPETLNFLNSPNRLAFTGLDYARRIVLLEALSNLNQILNGINYLGFPEDIVPIHSWRYLQNVARYFANQAIQMERAYITFKDTAEKEESTRLALEQTVDAAAAAVNVEVEREKAAREQQRIAGLSAEAAQTRLNNANDRKTDYASTSKELATLDEITAWATGPMDRAEVDAAWGQALGISPGEYDTYQVTRYAAWAKSKISRQYELRNMDRQIAEMEDAKTIADAQVDVAEKMVDVAVAQKELAELRQQQSQAQLDNFNAQEFTPELWSNLADAQRELSQRYLDWAIGAAFLMERAFEFEYDLNVNRIRFDYARSELHGLLSGDFLLADIDQFSFARLLDTEKQIPAKVVISLADRYPFQFYQEFHRTGRLEFDTLLEDFDLMHSGAHLRKLRRIEVIMEGIIGRQGAQGILRNAGFSFYRDRDGFRRTRVQKPETMMLSLYDIRRDGFVFAPEEGVLEIFENSGVASTWAIEFPRESNDLDYRAISNIHLVFYFDAYHSDRVAAMARAELEAGSVYQSNLGVGLRFQFPDEFFSLQDTGEVVFKVDTNYLPFHNTDPRIREAQIVVETEAGVSNAGLVVNLRSAAGGLDLSQSTDANGMIATSAVPSAIDAVRGQPLIDTWTVRFDPADNAAAFAAGFTWAKVTNVFWFVEYGYTPRGRALVSDDFAVNPLAEFDVVDDPAATTSAPSAWSHSAAFGGSIVQTSSIFGGPGGASSTPAKPGTYLVRKTSPAWPNLKNLSLTCTLRSSGDDGIGLIFRYQDVDNFYFFLMDRQRNYRRIGKKIGGTFQELSTPAFQAVTPGFDLNRDYEVSIASVDDAFTVFLDGSQILAGRDSSISQPGRTGLYTWGNNGASFLSFGVRPA